MLKHIFSNNYSQYDNYKYIIIKYLYGIKINF